MNKYARHEAAKEDEEIMVWRRYEDEKAKIAAEAKSAKEYERRIRELCERLKV